MRLYILLFRLQLSFFPATIGFTVTSLIKMNATRRKFISDLTSLGVRERVPVRVNESNSNCIIHLGVVGDVMIGRGVDAILPHSVDSTIHESYVKDANDYVRLAVRENGPLSNEELRHRGSSYIWGDVEQDLLSPDALIINLETALTQSENWAMDKGINYRSHPRNVESLTAIGVKVATLANNHVLDWGEDGLKETIKTLDNAGIYSVGAGVTQEEAAKPIFFDIDKENGSITVAVLAIGFPSAGVPLDWKADDVKCGVNVEEEADEGVAQRTIDSVKNHARKVLGRDPDVIIVSLHWGANWAWGIPSNWRKFSHKLVDLGADVVIGHSSHHVKGIEVYKNKFIAYGLGDFLNDYEGIVGQGYEDYRHDLAAFYTLSIELNQGGPTTLVNVDIIPCKIQHLKVQRATDSSDIAWLQSAFHKEGKDLRTSCEIKKKTDGSTTLGLNWL